MKRILYYLLPLYSVVMVACGGNEDSEIPEIKITELSFTTVVQTRALPNVLTELQNGSQMNIFVAFSNNSSLVSMKKAVMSNDLWKAVPSIELEEGISASFQAVYPYSDSYTSASAIPVEVKSQTDYLYSGNSVSVSRNNPTAQVTMKHAMAVFAFNIDKNGYSGSGSLQKITLSGSGLYTEGNMNISTGAITGTARGELAKSFSNTLKAGGFTNDIPAMFVIPSTSTGDNLLLTIMVDGKEYSGYLPKQSVSGGNKYLFRMALTERELVIFPELTETISLNADTDQMPERVLSSLKVVHSNDRMNVPVVTGSEGIFGKVYWGDGEAQNYNANTTHIYKMSGSHTITVETWGAEDVTMNNLSGVTEIDLSKF